MRRLYLQIYLTALGIILLFALLTGLAWFLHSPNRDTDTELVRGVGVVLGDLLPAPGAPRPQLQAAVERYGQLFAAHIGVYDARGDLLASRGQAPPLPGGRAAASGVVHARGSGFTLAIPLPDGRWVVAGQAESALHRALGGLLTLGLLALCIAVGAFPVVRRLTRRLERLQSRVEALGAGDLASRVDVEGRDEIARLARSFNRTADRIQDLVEAQRTMLASASHELRSPLARLRVALELLREGEAARPELHSQAAADIGELDELIGELLLASRLEAFDDLHNLPGGGDAGTEEEVDLLALMAEEGARVGAEISGDSTALLRADRRLLRRLARNLLENARRYGGESAIDVSVSVDDRGCRIRVDDRGPGVPAEEREKIFQPFYRRPGASEQGEGVGLGLFLVSRIARHYGGDVRCSPRAGGGTRFEVLLPHVRVPPTRPESGLAR